MSGFVCGHRECGAQPAPTQVCLHLLPAEEQVICRHYRRYTGKGMAFVLHCPTCDAAGPSANDLLCSLCMDCFKRAVTSSTSSLMVGVVS
jgi:hypothetical protein